LPNDAKSCQTRPNHAIEPGAQPHGNRRSRAGSRSSGGPVNGRPSLFNAVAHKNVRKTAQNCSPNREPQQNKRFTGKARSEEVIPLTP
jgi:hypothetical protein